MNKPLVIIPTYDERDNVQPIARAVLDRLPEAEVLFVDDNSPDGTGDLLDGMARDNPRIHVLHREGKQGLGRAYIAGFKWALARDYAYVFEMDADFSHDPTVLPVFLEQIKQYDLVIGSRYLNGISVVNWPLRRLMLSYFANWYTRKVTGLTIRDCTSGFKCFRRSLIERIDLDRVRSDGYSFQIEMHFRSAELGARICEVPIIFIDRRAGQSKMSKKIVREAVLMVWKLKLGSLLKRWG